MNLGVYITSKDDDLFIADVIKPVIEVFPQAEAIDLGSTDDSIEIIQKSGIPYNLHKDISGKEYTVLKNRYSKKHDWAVWIDSDEIYPVSSLLKMKELIVSGASVKASVPEDKNVFIPYENRKTVRCSWRLIREENSKLLVADKLRMNGHKAFDSKLYTFIEPWPVETLNGVRRLKDSKNVFNGVWCWHAVLLQRSSKGDNALRIEKKQAKLDEYIPLYEWSKVEKYPWI